MPSHISDHQYGQAVVDSVYNGTYPESEEIISGNLPQPALPIILNLVDQAREDVKRSIRKESKESAPDIDGWISQAKHLREDIENSKKTSQDIVNQAKRGETLQNQVNDATRKVGLLLGEVEYNQNVVEILEQIRQLKQVLRQGQEAVRSERLDEAVDFLLFAEHELNTLPARKITKIYGLLSASITEIRHGLVEKLKKCWKAFFQTDFTTATFSVKRWLPSDTIIDVSTVINALLKLNLLDSFVKSLYEELDILILKSRLEPAVGGSVRSLQVEGDEIKAAEQLNDLTMQKLFADMNVIVEFLHTRLPSPVSIPLSEMLVPRLISLVISQWLSVSLPTDVKAFHGFKDVLDLTLQFADRLNSYQWRGKDQLVEWANNIPQVWLNKRRGISLDKVRCFLAKGLGETESVERVETQVFKSGDDTFTTGTQHDDWNAGWSDDEASPPEKPNSSSAHEQPAQGTEEEVDAWGFDDDTNDDSLQETSNVSDVGTEEEDAWGWKDETEDDETEDDETAQSKEASQSDPEKSNLNGHHEVHAQTEREVTLKESYNISALPKQIFEIITEVIFDAEILKSSTYKDSPIASTIGGLFSLPGLILVMYRAVAPNFYSLDPSGSMFLYNDSLWLAESLRRFTGTQFKQTGHLNPGAAEVEISALEKFAKRTYAKEMESQRTVIGDLLDGAQGFANSTQPPFAQECDIAISSVVDRLREVHRQWKPVLSHSALLQSVGSLLSTIAKKFIFDIEEMSDISEPESHRLAGFCATIASLEDLFTPPVSDNAPTAGEQAIPLTAVYSPNWLKFQYLANILESSLVDIKYLWTEGELRLEFEAEELVDLVKALFADSDHRRRAIAEIRKS